MGLVTKLAVNGSSNYNVGYVLSYHVRHNVSRRNGSIPLYNFRMALVVVGFKKISKAILLIPSTPEPKFLHGEDGTSIHGERQAYA